MANNLQVERKVISQAIGVSPASLARRAKTGRFSTVESDRLIALIAVFEQALFLFEGRRHHCNRMDELAGSKALFKASTGAVEDEGGDERCVRPYWLPREGYSCVRFDRRLVRLRS